MRKSAEDVKDYAKEKAPDVKGSMAEVGQQMKSGAMMAKEIIVANYEIAKDYVKAKAPEVKECLRDSAQQTKEAAVETTEYLKERAPEVKEHIKSTTEQTTEAVGTGVATMRRRWEMLNQQCASNCNADHLHHENHDEHGDGRADYERRLNHDDHQ